MQLSISKEQFIKYTERQLNNLFPDNNITSLTNFKSEIDTAISRVEYCFKHSSFDRYCKQGQTFLNHLYTDQYLMYIWFLANTLWKANGHNHISTKLYALNKALHGLDCMYDTELPDIFLIFHSVGTMIGKASYSNFFVILQGCTVGANKGVYPKFGKGVALAANSSVIGNCHIGDNVSIGASTLLLDKDVPSNNVIFRADNGELILKPSFTCYAQTFFNTSIN